ncbi:MAG: Sjogren's syndrome/scleroderma autoantigen 1 family protein [Promethearchaeati archaeon]
MENEKIKKMADLLRSGNKMLNFSCPECNSPIFQNKEGDLFCPTCNRKVVMIENKNELNQDNAVERRIEYTEENIEQDINQSVAILREKIDWLLNEIQSETQIENLKNLLDLLKKIYDLLFYIRS